MDIEPLTEQQRDAIENAVKAVLHEQLGEQVNFTLLVVRPVEPPSGISVEIISGASRDATVEVLRHLLAAMEAH